MGHQWQSQPCSTLGISPFPSQRSEAELVWFSLFLSIHVTYRQLSTSKSCLLTFMNLISMLCVPSLHCRLEISFASGLIDVSNPQCRSCFCWEIWFLLTMEIFKWENVTSCLADLKQLLLLWPTEFGNILKISTILLFLFHFSPQSLSQICILFLFIWHLQKHPQF